MKNNAKIDLTMTLLVTEYERVSAEVKEEGTRILQLWLALGVVVTGAIAFISQGWITFVAPLAIYLWAWFMLLLLYQIGRRIRFLSHLEARINRIVGNESLLSFQKFMYSPPSLEKGVSLAHFMVSSFWGIMMAICVIGLYVGFSIIAILQVQGIWQIISAVISLLMLLVLIFGYVSLNIHGNAEAKALSKWEKDEK